MDKACIYLDHHATTPMDLRVFEKMKPFFLEHFGNPASKTHSYGWHAQNAVDEARSIIAKSINADPSEIIFSSGATESTNMAIKGMLDIHPNEKNEILCSSIEHSATLASMTSLIKSGYKNIRIKPDKNGIIKQENLASHLSDSTALVSLFFVNNEIGSINDIKKLSSICRKKNILFHCDAAQALGRVKLDVNDLDIDLMSLSGHKIYGPKGVGVLFIKKNLKELLHPLLDGGCHEWCKRSGTLNVPGIVGMAEACRLASLHQEEECIRIKGLRDRLWQQLSVLPECHLNGSFTQRVPGNLNISFKGIDGEALVLEICPKVAISTGSACASGQNSRVLEQIGVPNELSQSALRFGIGRTNTEKEIDMVAKIIIDAVLKLRKTCSKNKNIKIKGL